MKIAYLFETFPSATETFLAREVEALRHTGFEIEVWALNAGEGARRIPSPPRALKVTGRESYRKVQAALLTKQLQQHHIAHIHATWANHIADLAWCTAQKAQLPWSFAAHARDLWVDGGDLKAKLQSAKFAATCTRAGEVELRRFGDNVLYAPHGLPVKQYEFRPWEGSREIRILGVGRLIEKKGWLDLLEAVAQLKQRGTQVSAQIVGEGPLRVVMEKRIAERQLSSEVELLGALPHPEVIAAMQRSNCFVLPSQIARDGDRDGLANVLLEAGALGVPIVTTDAGAARDFVDEATGRIVSSGDPDALATTIGQTFQSVPETQARCRAARKQVEAEFDVEKNVGVMAAAFRDERRN